VRGAHIAQTEREAELRAATEHFSHHHYSKGLQQFKVPCLQ